HTISLFSFTSYVYTPTFHSFPTRRSSDLGDKIYAVLKGVASSSDGRANRSTLPAPRARPRPCARRTASPAFPRPPSSSWKRTGRDRKSTRLNSSHVSNSYAVFCLEKKK